MIAVLACLLSAAPAGAQNTGAAAIEPGSFTPLSQQEIVDLVAPIALYPDDLIGIILPASTYPLQIVEAARFLTALDKDPSLEPDPDWDNSVVALLNYPEALHKLDADLDWTWTLGQAVLNQQSSVIDAIQSFREQAYLAGNLQSDDRQTVTEDEGVIEIAPADPEVVYIPYYEPERVVVRQPAPVYYYYDRAYPLYYYPYPAGYAFGSPFFWGVTSAFAIGWHTHYVQIYAPSYFGHPYYGYAYNSPYYWRRGININININHTSHVWQPGDRREGRPNHHRDGNRAVPSSDDYVDSLRRARQARTDSRETLTGTRGGAFRSQAPRQAAPATRAPSSGQRGERPIGTSSRTVDNSRATAADRSTISRGTGNGTSLTSRNPGGRIGTATQRGDTTRRAVGPAQSSRSVATRARPGGNARINTGIAPQRRLGASQAAPQFGAGGRQATSTRPAPRVANRPSSTSGRSQTRTASPRTQVAPRAAPRASQSASRAQQRTTQRRASAPRGAGARGGGARQSDIRSGNGRLPRRN